MAQQQQIRDAKKIKIDFGVKLTEDNYDTWKFELDGFLDTHTLTELVANHLDKDVLPANRLVPTALQSQKLNVFRDQINKSLDDEPKQLITSSGENNQLQMMRNLDGHYGTLTEQEETAQYNSFTSDKWDKKEDPSLKIWQAKKRTLGLKCRAIVTDQNIHRHVKNMFYNCQPCL